jgi:hypothetical protein
MLRQASLLMDATNTAAREYLGDFNEVFEKLEAGDPAVTRLYAWVSQNLPAD